MKNKALVTSLLWASLLTLGLSFGAWAQVPKSMRVGYMPIASDLPIFAAIENGYFREEGIAVKLEAIGSGPAMIPPLVGGSLETAAPAYFPIFAARAAGMELLIILGKNRETTPQPYVSILVLEGSGIDSPKDLEGKAFGITGLKSVDWLTISEWMVMNGADPKKVQWVELPFPGLGGALRAKTVQAIVSADPFTTVQLAQGGVKIIGYPFAAVAPNLPVAGFIVMEPWYKKNKELADSFSRAVAKGIDYINARPEKRSEILTKYTRIDPELAAKLKFYPGFDRFIDAQALQKTIDLAVKYGLVSKRLEVKDMVAPGVLR